MISGCQRYIGSLASPWWSRAAWLLPALALMACSERPVSVADLPGTYVHTVAEFHASFTFDDPSRATFQANGVVWTGFWTFKDGYIDVATNCTLPRRCDTHYSRLEPFWRDDHLYLRFNPDETDLYVKMNALP